MRSFLTVALAGTGFFLLSGCDFLEGGSSEVAECEAFIKQQLVAPSTYRQIEAQVHDSSLLTAREFQERLGDKTPPRESRLRLRTVNITYDAQNALGVALQDETACQFKITEEEREAELISPTAYPREIEDAAAREVDAQFPPDEENLFGDEPTSLRDPCCLPAEGR